MKKTVLLIGLTLVLFHHAFSQEALARIEYSEADKSYQSQEYQAAIDHLNKAKKMLGSSNQRIMYLEILSYIGLYSLEILDDHWVTKSPFWKYPINDLKLVDSLSQVYLTHFESSAPLDKIKKVYETRKMIEPFLISTNVVQQGIDFLKQGDANLLGKADELLTKGCNAGNTYACRVLEYYSKPMTQLIDGLVKVEGGTFNMGCNKEDGCDKSEKPLHSVTVSAFLISKTEFTRSTYAVMVYYHRLLTEPDRYYYDNDDPTTFECGECPMGGISYDTILLVLEILERLTGMEFRLPTEAEWEFAARGGNQSKGYLYAGSNNRSEVVQSIKKKLWPVAQLKPNELGLYDMSGNAAELCQDFADDKYYKNGPSLNPINTTDAEKRVIRGGTSTGQFGLSNTRVFDRLFIPKDAALFDLGFRLVAEPK